MLTPRPILTFYKKSETCVRETDNNLLKRQKNLISKIMAPITISGAAKSGDFKLSS